MELEHVSLPTQGSSSFHHSLSHSSSLATQQQLELAQSSTNIVVHAPPTKQYKSPRKEDTLSTQSAKRRQPNIVEQGAKTNSRVLDIDIIAQMWLEFPIHEAIALDRGNIPLKEKRTKYDLECLGTPPSQIEEFHTLIHAFPRVTPKLYPIQTPICNHGATSTLHPSSTSRKCQHRHRTLRGFSSHHPL